MEWEFLQIGPQAWVVDPWSNRFMVSMVGTGGLGRLELVLAILAVSPVFPSLSLPESGALVSATSIEGLPAAPHVSSRWALA